jgi:hypothetical protein
MSCPSWCAQKNPATQRFTKKAQSYTGGLCGSLCLLRVTLCLAGFLSFVFEATCPESQTFGLPDFLTGLLSRAFYFAIMKYLCALIATQE